MNGFWVWLRECWALPIGAPAEHQRLLVHRQVLNLFRVVPWYVASNLYTGGGVFLVMWPFVRQHRWWPWALLFVCSHLAWAWHAWSRLRASRGPGEPPLIMRDMWVSLFWCSASALSCGIGIYLAAPLADDDGSRLLLSAYTPGLIATGVLVGITTPLLAFAWLLVLTVSAHLMVMQIEFLSQGMTIALLVCYAFMLSVALLFASRLFVKRIEAELAADQQREIVGLLLRDFETNANDWLWEADRDGRLTRVGARLEQVLGAAPDALCKRELASLFARERMLVAESDQEVGPDALQRSLRASAAFSGVVVEAQVAGVARSWTLSAKPLHAASGEWIGWRGVGSEVTDARAREADAIARERQLDHLASHDALTGLPNRRAFLQWVEEEGAASASLALALIDLDNFKAVNDTLGHAAGDKVLCAVARRLQRLCRGQERVARLGGDEFAMLVQGADGDAGEGALRQRLQALLASLRIPEWVDGFRVDVRASIGVALPAGGRGDGGELLRHADTALYDAKNGGRDTYRVYRVEMSDRLRQRLAMVSDLAGAALGGQLALKYMALRRVDDLAVHAYEALLRWNHPVHGEMSPALFLPVAEESGLIDGIGLWVLERACRDALAWDASVSVCVNVSAVQLADPMLAARIVGILERVGLPASRLELEVTETSFVKDTATARVALSGLREHGIGIAMDDFGVGYSSMAQLRLLPFDRIKLDMSFAQALLTERDADLTRSIIESVVRIARARDVPVTAEGVEDERQLQALRELGCASVQGYLFGRPAPADTLPGVVGA